MKYVHNLDSISKLFFIIKAEVLCKCFLMQSTVLQYIIDNVGERLHEIVALVCRTGGRCLQLVRPWIADAVGTPLSL